MLLATLTPYLALHGAWLRALVLNRLEPLTLVRQDSSVATVCAISDRWLAARLEAASDA